MVPKYLLQKWVGEGGAFPEDGLSGTRWDRPFDQSVGVFVSIHQTLVYNCWYQEEVFGGSNHQGGEGGGATWPCRAVPWP